MSQRIPSSSYHNNMVVHHDYHRDPHDWTAWSPVLNPAINEYAGYLHTTDYVGNHVHLGVIGLRATGHIRTVYWTYADPCPDPGR